MRWRDLGGELPQRPELLAPAGRDPPTARPERSRQVLELRPRQAPGRRARGRTASSGRQRALVKIVFALKTELLGQIVERAVHPLGGRTKRGRHRRFCSGGGGFITSDRSDGRSSRSARRSSGTRGRAAARPHSAPARGLSPPGQQQSSAADNSAASRVHSRTSWFSSAERGRSPASRANNRQSHSCAAWAAASDRHRPGSSPQHGQRRGAFT